MLALNEVAPEGRLRSVYGRPQMVGEVTLTGTMAPLSGSFLTSRTRDFANA